MKRFMLFSLCALMLLVTGCGVAKLKNGEEVAVALKGENITANDLYNELKDKYAKSVIVDMIDKIILNKEYKTTDDMTKAVNSQVSYYKENLGDNFLTTIKSQLGLENESEFFDYLMLNYKRNQATRDYIKGIITDTEINNYYQNKSVGDVYVSHILIKPNTTDSMTDAEKTAAKEKALSEAKDIIKKLDNGEDFATLAKKYSDDSGTASNGGVVGWINKNDSTWSEAFRIGAYALKKGEYSKTPVESEFGYHIIIVTNTKDKLSLKDSKEGIITALTTEKLNEENNTYSYQAMVALRKEYNLDIKDSELKKQYDSYMDELLDSSK